MPHARSDDHLSLSETMTATPATTGRSHQDARIGFTSQQEERRLPGHEAVTVRVAIIAKGQMPDGDANGETG
jgi:hypothetical protein